MRSHLHTWQLLSVIVAGCLDAEQQRVIDYLRAETQILREHLGSRRFRPIANERRRLAVLGVTLGRKKLAEICSIVTPDTILRWHRRLIAKKYDGSGRRKPGRPRVIRETRKLVVLMASENRTWGFERIEGELRKLGYRVARTTTANILREQGLEPAPTRAKHSTWAEFLRTHWGSIAAVDFFTVETWTLKGLTRYHVLFVIDLSTRRIEIAGVSYRPHGEWASG